MKTFCMKQIHKHYKDGLVRSCPCLKMNKSWYMLQRFSGNSWEQMLRKDWVGGDTQFGSVPAVVELLLSSITNTPQ